MNRHLIKQPGVGDTISFWGSGRGASKRHTGVIRSVIDPNRGSTLSDASEVINEFPNSRLAFDPTISGRNGSVRHYLVEVNKVLYRPNLSRISPPQES